MAKGKVGKVDVSKDAKIQLLKTWSRSDLGVEGLGVHGGVQPKFVPWGMFLSPLFLSPYMSPFVNTIRWTSPGLSSGLPTFAIDRGAVLRVQLPRQNTEAVL